jgi:ribosomal protein RSM22 (predicted rRNA methylase)
LARRQENTLTSQNDNLAEASGPLADLVQLSFEELKKHLLISNITEPEIVKLINEMSLKFTKAREHITDYVFEHRHVSAYAAFYLPTNMPKLHFLLSKLPAEILLDFKNRPFIDMGCGPGTFSLAWKKLLNIPAFVEMTGVDSAQIMLDQASKMMTGFFPKDKFQITRKFSEKKSNSVLFFGHSINEMGIAKAREQVMTIDPEYVIWIEPGTSELFLELKNLRGDLCEHYEVLYPCPSSEACPSDWCHQVLRTTHHQSIERLSQLVSLDRKTMPMTAHVYRRKKTQGVATALINAPTTIRFLNETKFSFEYEVCYFDNNQNKNDVIEIQKKHLSKDEEKYFKHADVGEKIPFEVEKIVGEKLRVRLLK